MQWLCACVCVCVCVCLPAVVSRVEFRCMLRVRPCWGVVLLAWARRHTMPEPTCCIATCGPRAPRSFPPVLTGCHAPVPYHGCSQPLNQAMNALPLLTDPAFGAIMLSCHLNLKPGHERKGLALGLLEALCSQHGAVADVRRRRCGHGTPRLGGKLQVSHGALPCAPMRSCARMCVRVCMVGSGGDDGSVAVV